MGGREKSGNFILSQIKFISWKEVREKWNLLSIPFCDGNICDGNINIFYNNPDKLLVSRNISDITDHFSKFCITTLAKDNLQQVKNVKICDYSRFSIDRFNNELSEVNWNQVIANGTNCVHKLFSLFCNKYNTIVKKHAPMKKSSNHKANLNLV